MNGQRPSLPIKAAALVSAAAVALGFGAWPEPGSAPGEGVRSVVAKTIAGEKSQLQKAPIGAASCSARACHGGLEPGSTLVLRNEYTTWLTRDPHADAFRTLLGDRSKAISDRLANGSTHAISAHEDTRCLACHAVPSTARSPALASLRTEGVSCEACHGEASHWRAPHTLQSWDSLSLDDKSQQYGMTAIQDLTTRAQVCSACHVGAPADASLGLPARDVNHDLIAAGHPRLTFELSAYLADMPHHWADSFGGRALTPEERGTYEARVWAAGQVALAQASLRLLSARAETQTAPWPEFAEYDCFACHHGLHEPSRRQLRGYEGHTPGAPLWGTWPTAMLPRVFALVAAGTEPSAAPPLAEADALKAAMSRSQPDRTHAAHQANRLARELDPWLTRAAKFPGDRAVIRTALRGILDQSRTAEYSSWDARAQRFLAAMALDQALKAGDAAAREPNREAELKAIAENLAFPPGYDSPKDD